jgi:CTP:molybdopterin cytidylyltransferase MocA
MMTTRQRPAALLFGTTQLPFSNGHGVLSSPLTAHIDSLRRAGIDTIALVASTGAGAAVGKLAQVRVVLHSGLWNSPFDEIVLGLFALERAPVLVMPVDHEVISDETLSLLVHEAARSTTSHAIVPFHHERSGYPVVLFQSGVDAVVREAANPNGMRRLDQLIRSWQSGVQSLPVADETVTSELLARA